MKFKRFSNDEVSLTVNQFIVNLFVALPAVVKNVTAEPFSVSKVLGGENKIVGMFKVGSLYTVILKLVTGDLIFEVLSST